MIVYLVPSLLHKFFESKEKLSKKLKNKNSAGCDGLSQSQLISGSPSLMGPLLNIYNTSIKIGSFPSNWKEAVVTPVLKKGHKEVVIKEIIKFVKTLPI